MCIICCRDVGSGLTIHSTSHLFWCHWNWNCCWLQPRSWNVFCRRFGILYMWCGSVCLHPRSSSCIHFQRILYVRVHIFILFGCAFTFFVSTYPIWIWSRVFVGVGSVIITGLKCGEHLGALSGLLYFILGAGSVSHPFLYLFLSKTLYQLLTWRSIQGG